MCGAGMGQQYRGAQQAVPLQSSREVSPRQAYGRWISDWPGLAGRWDWGDGTARIADPGVAGVAGVAGRAALGVRGAPWATPPPPPAARAGAAPVAGARRLGPRLVGARPVGGAGGGGGGGGG